MIHVTCTLITSSYPATVTKEFALNTDGTLDKRTTAHVTTGRMETVRFASLKEFSALLEGLGTNQCLVYGVPPHSPVDLVTEKSWATAGRPISQIARTKKTMSWPSGPGILMLDYDAPKDGKSALSKEQLLQAVFETCPNLELFDNLWWPSTSSCIWQGGKELTGIKGQRLYFAVADARDIPRLGKVILTKLWAKGYGNFEVSKSGSLLERGLFDASVWQTNRIDFASGAKCHGELEQRRGDPILHHGIIDSIVDSTEFVANPSAEEIALADSHKAIQKAAASEGAIRVREVWKLARVEEMAGRHPDTPKEQIEATIVRAVERRDLLGDWIVTVIVNDTRQDVTVLQLLDNPHHYHGMLTLDPLEPDYDGGRPVGKLFLIGARPRLHSMAHGGTSFKLSRSLAGIEIVKGKERETTDSMLEILRLAPDVFDFGAELVTVGDGGELMPQNEHGLRYLAGGVVQFWRWHQLPKGGSVEALENPPSGVCRSVLALRGNRHLKPLDAVISAPTLRPDGSVLSSIGYDEATRLLFEADDVPQEVPHNPTRAQAAAALKAVWNVFETFPFVGPLDRAVHLAAILTAAIRPVISTAPAFAYDAPVQGSGKTLLARCIGALATGSDPDIWPHTSGRDDEETRKRLFTALRSGARAIVWDNVVGTFDSAAMASLLTSDRYRDRVLGKSESSSVPNRALMLMTGNNLTVAGDMARRVLVARIDPNIEKPFARAFNVDPLAVCIAERQQIIGAALTLIRYYLSSGIQRPGAGRIASFEAWDDWVRQTVIYIDHELASGKFGDVLDQIQINQASDPDQEALGILLHALRVNFGDSSFSAAEVLEKAKSTDFDDDKTLRVGLLFNSLEGFKTGHGDLTAKSLGRILLYRKGRIVGGLLLEKAGGCNNTTLWRVRYHGAAEITNESVILESRGYS
jgi:hypothetical protein